MKRIFVLAVAFWCLLLSGCSQPSEKLPADYLSRWEGEGTHWKVSAEIPYSPENTEQYMKVTFTCDSPDSVYDENGQVYFFFFLSVGSCSFTYDKAKGLLGKDEYYSSNASGVERVTPVSDTEFEVLYEKKLIDIGLEEKSQNINVQLPGENIDLRHVES